MDSVFLRPAKKSKKSSHVGVLVLGPGFTYMAMLSPFLTGRTVSSLNLVWTVQWTTLRFLTNLLMRCKLQPKLRCAGCTQTCVHMLTHQTCSLMPIRDWNPWQWTPWLCHALTYLWVFIRWVPQKMLTLPQVHKWSHFLRRKRLKTFLPSAMCCCSRGELSGFNQSDARFVKLEK